MYCLCLDVVAFGLMFVVWCWCSLLLLFAVCIAVLCGLRGDGCVCRALTWVLLIVLILFVFGLCIVT